MDDFPDYKTYSLAQLYDIARHIDKEKYPDRFALLEKEIQNKERKRAEALPVAYQNAKPKDSSVQQNPQKMRGGCGGGCASVIVGIIAGIVVSLLWLNVWLSFHPQNQIAAGNMDGMNRWGGHMGTAMIGILFGCIGGSCVAFGKEPIKVIVVTTIIFAVTMPLLMS